MYDPEIAATPEEEIRIYSLYENYTIRQAVSLYQKSHPEVYVNYEVGISGEDGMTEEDAVRNLNTRLASGSGPDLLVLDGLPKSSYAVSYTHLDVYKRQGCALCLAISG